MNETQIFEKKFQKAKGYDKSRLLLNTYKQVTTSHKGKKNNGLFRSFAEKGTLDSLLFLSSFCDQLEHVGFVDHAMRLRQQNYQDQMNKLQEQVGKEVHVAHVYYDQIETEWMTIKKVSNFENIE